MNTLCFYIFQIKYLLKKKSGSKLIIALESIKKNKKKKNLFLITTSQLSEFLFSINYLIKLNFKIN